MSLAIVNGKVKDEKNKISVRNLLIKGAKIAGVGYIPDEDESSLEICDVTHAMLLPNTFDFIYAPAVLDVFDYTAWIQSKGIINLMYLPNSATLCIDQPEHIKQLKSNLGDLAPYVKIAACASKDNGVSELSELSLLVQAGADAIYFDRITENELLFKQALTYVDMINIPIVFGPMTMMEARGAHLNEGATSFEIGIRGDAESHEVNHLQFVCNMVKKHTQVPIHFQCLSSFDAIESIQSFKSHRPNVTVGASPFHMVLSDEALATYNTHLKFNPPLRSEVTRKKLMSSLSKGFVDHLTALHSPVVGDSQEKSFFDHSFHVQTLGSYFHIVSHLFLEENLALDRYDFLLSSPSPLALFESNSLSLGDSASFIALDAKKSDMKAHDLFDSIQISLSGGIRVIVNQGERITK
tara:strand:- start:3381 stop:4610 length:1230 start_codon:yes stop_codon:yes gene_type:complete